MTWLLAGKCCNGLLEGLAYRSICSPQPQLPLASAFLAPRLAWNGGNDSHGPWPDPFSGLAKDRTHRQPHSRLAITHFASEHRATGRVPSSCQVGRINAANACEILILHVPSQRFTQAQPAFLGQPPSWAGSPPQNTPRISARILSTASRSASSKGSG